MGTLQKIRIAARKNEGCKTVLANYKTLFVELPQIVQQQKQQLGLGTDKSTATMQLDVQAPWTIITLEHLRETAMESYK